MAAVLVAATLGGACGDRGTPEQVAAACEHQIMVGMRGAIAGRVRHAGAQPTTEAEARTAIERALHDALTTESAREGLARCRSLYAELSSERLACILAAGDPVSVNACTPQADRSR